MKFAHMADVHIGSWRDPKLKELSSKAFEKAVDLCIIKSVDFVLIAGDLFNNALPAIESIKDCVKQLKRLKDNNIPVYLIGGSHDYSASGKTMLDVFEEAGLCRNVMKGSIEEGTLRLAFTEDRKTKAKITGILGKKGMLDRAYYEQLSHGNLDSEKGFKIFMFHTALSELKPAGMDAMNSAPLAILPNGFDYYAGGHVHAVLKTKHGKGLLAYPGPLFPANFSELEELEKGGFFIYDEGALERVEIRIKPVSAYKISLEGKTPEQAMIIIQEAIREKELKDSIALLRISGQLKGKTTDLDFRKIFQELYAKKAFFVMKNTSKLVSESFEQAAEEIESPNKIEEEILKKHSEQFKTGFDQVETAKKLFSILDSEKHEGEKQYEYEARIKKEVSRALGF